MQVNEAVTPHRVISICVEGEECLTYQNGMVMLRLQLPKSLMQQIHDFQERMNLYHSVGAIRYLLLRGLMFEDRVEMEEQLFS